MNKIIHGASGAILHIRQKIVRELDPAGVWLDYPEEPKVPVVEPVVIPPVEEKIPEEKKKISWEIEDGK